MRDAAERRQRRMRRVGLALRIVAEAGWITVLYAAVCVLVSRHPPALGPLELAAAVAVGLLVGRWGRTRLEFGALLLIAAVLAVGAVGWLASGDARSLLPSLPQALNVHMAGWLAGIAVVRGALIGGRSSAAAELEGSMRVVPVVLALVWAYTSLAVVPALWLPFAVSALWGTVAYFATALPAIGWARLDVLHANLADDRRRRDWRWLVTAVGFGAVPVAIPLAIVSGIPAELLLSPIVGPIQWLLVLVGIPLSWIIWLASELIRPFAGPLAEGLVELARRRPIRVPAPGEPDPLAELISTIMAASLVVLTILVVLVAIFLFARWLITRGRGGSRVDESEPDVERTIVVPPRKPKPAPVRSVPRQRIAPRDVVTAYLGALAELEGHFDLPRMPNETPAQHVLRLRQAGASVGTDLARLAAGYQLARYGQRRITALENVRAVSRFQRLRRLLRASGA